MGDFAATGFYPHPHPNPCIFRFARQVLTFVGKFCLARYGSSNKKTAVAQACRVLDVKGQDIKIGRYRELLGVRSLPFRVQCSHGTLLPEFEDGTYLAREYANHLEVIKDITDYIMGFYNCVRLHSTLGNLPPIVYEMEMAAKEPNCCVRKYLTTTALHNTAVHPTPTPALPLKGRELLPASLCAQMPYYKSHRANITCILPWFIPPTSAHSGTSASMRHLHTTQQDAMNFVVYGIHVQDAAS